VGVKLALASIVFGQMNYFVFPHIVDQATFRNPFFVFQLMSLVVNAVFTILYYWSIAGHMSRITKMRRSA